MKEVQKSSEEEVPIEIVESLLREHLGDKYATITQFYANIAEEFQKVSFGGSGLYRVKAVWETGSRTESANWVIKRWRRGGLVGAAMGVISPVEALAWNHGLMRDKSLPERMIVPYIGARLDDKQTDAWIVMEDVSDEINAFSTIETIEEKLEQAKFILDRLACFHAYWEKPDRLSELEKHSWLLQQERYLWASADSYSIFLGRISQEATKNPVHPRIEIFRKPSLAFLDWLPVNDRAVWEEHLCNREALVEAYRGLPQTLFHGDLSLDNIGLRWGIGKPEVLLVDWELMGVGSGALDVATFIIRALEWEAHIFYGTESLSDYYFDCYITHGGTALDYTTWDRSYNLAYLFNYLWQFPFRAGRVVDPEKDATISDVNAIKEKTERVTGAIKKWLC